MKKVILFGIFMLGISLFQVSVVFANKSEVRLRDPPKLPKDPR